MNICSLISTRCWSNSVWVLAVLLQGAVFAEEPTLIEFDIDAQELGDALTEFGVQSGKEVYFVSADVTGVQAPRIEGRYFVADAIQQLLGMSGVEYFIDDNGTLLVGTAFDQGGDSEQKNLSPAPVLMAQNVSQTATSTETSSRSDDGGTSIVTGKVTDARTGANLKGAKITIEETGQWTSTNDLGEFRFVNVPMGSATLTVSYLGYAGQSEILSIRSDRISENFALRGGDEIEEIVVFGQRSARAQALNQERTAENFTTVLSSDALGQFDGTTISESLRRAPGIAFQQDSRTGDGTNVIVRGLGPDFNSVTLNGLRLPEGSGVGRSPDLSNLLTESVAKITISKTLLPSQDSSGTGALIDVETKSPLDRPDRYLNLGIEQGETSDRFVDDWLLGATVSGTFGAQRQLGLSMSVQYRERDISTVGYDISGAAGQYLPLSATGTPLTSISQVNPLRQFPFEDGVDEFYPNFVSNFRTRNRVENEGFNVSAAWQISDGAKIRIDYDRLNRRQELYNNALNVDVFAGYELLPIDGLGGEQRAALVWGGDSASGGPLNVFQQYQVALGREDKTDALSLRGSWENAHWELDATVGYTQGERSRPNEWSLLFRGGTEAVELDDLQGSATENQVDGRVVHPYSSRTGAGYPLPLFTDNGFDRINNPDRYFLNNGATISTREGANDRETLDLSVKRLFEASAISYLQFGLFYERSEFASVNTVHRRLTTLGNPLSTLGLEFAGQNLQQIGLNNGFDVIREVDMIDFTRSLTNNATPAASDLTVFRVPTINDFLAIVDLDAFFSDPGRYVILEGVENDPRRLDVITEEEEIAPFFQGRLDIGKLEVIGGVRVSRVDTSATNITNPTIRDVNGVPDLEFAERFRTLVRQQAEQTEVLPRLLANYRYSDNLIVRAGYFRSIARPSIGDISDDQTVVLDLQSIYGPASNQPGLFIDEGNPDLQPAITDNFDLGFEFYFDDIGVAKLSMFYKETKNFLESNLLSDVNLLSNVQLPDDPRFQNLPDDIFVEVRRPVNSDDNARIWGIETALEKRFSFLSGHWSGVGVYANYTYTDSSKSQVFNFFDPAIGDFSTVIAPDVPFAQQPEHSGTLALTYNNYGIDGSLSFTRQSRRLNQFRAHNLHRFDEADESLDLRIQYELETGIGHYRLYLEGADLAKGSSDPDVEKSFGGLGPTPLYYSGGTYLGGRIIRVGVSGTF